MASIIRSAKSGNYWTDNDLYAFNIQVVVRNVQQFFGIDQLPPPGISTVILDNQTLPDGLRNLPKTHPGRKDFNFFALLSDIVSLGPGQESSVDDFARFLLEMMDFDEGSRVLHTRRELHFTMCGQRVDAKTDVCLMQLVSNTLLYILLIQEDKRHISSDDPEAQLIVDACAAFVENNKVRELAMLPRLETMTFPGITMIGSMPIFYKIHISEGLMAALRSGQYPEVPTIVEKLYPPVNDLGELLATGMQKLHNRAVIFQCFQAFKALVHNI
ncbi:hypothetical protein HGRIS_014921 [Hohenbuehelia grisea]|uniref:Uncharacterized protein n=1 Tax=Hohenbuehelia grisea TaxID=104357 RepID=A0ABR3JGH3_9AGAR